VLGVTGFVVEAAKPPGGGSGPTATGTIFYTNNGTTWAMNADGSSKTQVLPVINYPHPLFPSGADPDEPYGLVAAPADRVFGSSTFHDRWYLAFSQTGTYSEVIQQDGSSQYDVAHYDLVAFRTVPSDPLNPNVEIVPLTDLFGLAAIPSDWPDLAQWSNDTNDTATSYVGVASAYDLRDTFSNIDGYTLWDLRDAPEVSLRLPLTGSQIDAGVAAYRPADPADLDEVILPAVPAPGYKYGYSPTGGEFALAVSGGLQIHDVADLSLIDALSTSPATRPDYTVVWSRNGNSISFYNDVLDSPGGVWTIPSGGGSPVQRLKNSQKGFKYTRHSSQRWSHDSQFLVVQYYSYDISRPDFAMALLRIPAEGGATTNLTGNLANTSVSPIRWVSNTAAP
jgi:hypothetical protein